jgi:hypothetical protein
MLAYKFFGKIIAKLLSKVQNLGFNIVGAIF